MIQKNYSRHMMTVLETALVSFKVINLIGPRQVGKTTMVRDHLGRGRYITLDEKAILQAIEADAVQLLTDLKEDADDEPVIIDEAQRSKQLALALKVVVDRDRRKGQFILTGSSNIFAMADIPDALPGRVVPMGLSPLMISEIKNRPPSRLLDWTLQKNPRLTQINCYGDFSRKECVELIVKGGFPEPRDLPIRERQQLYQSYVDVMVDRDVRTVFPVRKTDKFRKLINQVAIRTAQEVNRSELSKLIGIKRETVEDYLDVMTRLSLVTQVEAWTSSEAKREKKLPKFHFIDTGMNCALRRLDEHSFDLGTNTAQFGGLVESWVFNELLRLLPLQSKEFRLFHWRTADRREIDIIAEGGNRIVGIEVKASASVSERDFKHIKWFANTGPGKSRAFTGIVFYLGSEKLSFGDGCYAIPVSALWAEIRI
ncbi:MAG: ATP-binding protein [Aestuariivita sp.]|nr:ATP-binding protein [Aestuariivita sp.]